MTLTVLAGSWIAGTYLATLATFSWLSALLFLLASALLALLLRGRGFTMLPALALAVLCLGALRAGWPSENRLPLPIQGYNGMGRIEVEGIISADPQPVTSGWRFPLSVNRVKTAEGWKDSRGDLLVVARPSPSLIAARQEPLFRYGDRLVLTGEAEEPPVLQDFDYREYLARQGILSTMAFPGVELVGEGEGSSVLGGIYSLRHRLSRSLSQALAEPQNSLAQALLLGWQSTMPPKLAQAFRDTGTTHILAISGLNIGILLAFSVAVSRWLLGARRQLYLIIPLLFIWGYDGLAGVSPSVHRAVIMGSIYLVGLYLGRQNSVMPALAAAAAFMVGLQPRVLFDVSFQLSFMAMAGLVLLAPPIERGLRRVFTDDEEEEGRWSRALAYAVAATVAATLATLPLVAFYFHQVSLVGLPATLLAMPVLAPVMVVGLITAALGLVSTGAAQVAGWGTWLFLSYLKLVVELFDAVPGNIVKIGWMGAPLVVVYYGVLIGFIAGRSRLRLALPVLPEAVRKALRRLGTIELESRQGRDRVFWAMVALALLASAGVWTAALSRPDGQLHVTFLDVGQGDATFIVTPGGRQVLIDGGPDPRRLLTLLGSRMPFWNHSLDLVVLTHPHEDHVSSATEVLRRYDVALVLERKFDYPSPEYALWQSTLVERGVPVLQALTGQQIKLDRGLVLEVLYPPDRLLSGTTSDVNNASVVTRLVYGETSFLFTGDLQWDGESYLLHRTVPLQSTVLKVAHQGSNTSTTPAFLREVSPQFAVIPVGEDNRFGHPHQETLDTLAQVVAEDHILMTSKHGDVEFIADGSRLRMRTER
ncbi:MAG: DNA internalization-related competence protein ComEC/Rec2 [Chloroflexi bacterium]|nr:DNA internalization-related competence protein ComEC/Rec2 [Chloroflexota bacterium]